MSIEYVELTITDAEPINITISDIPEAGSGGGGLEPIAANRLLGNLTGSTALPTGQDVSAVRDWLDYRTGNTLFVDAETGNDSTGTPTGSRPYATCLAAETAASSGDLIVVRPGSYSGNSLGTKTGIRWYWQDGSSYAKSGSGFGSIYEITGNVSVSGYGVFSTTDGPGLQTGASAVCTFEAKQITTSNFGCLQLDGDCRVKVGKLVSTAYDCVIVKSSTTGSEILVDIGECEAFSDAVTIENETTPSVKQVVRIGRINSCDTVLNVESEFSATTVIINTVSTINADALLDMSLSANTVDLFVFDWPFTVPSNTNAIRFFALDRVRDASAINAGTLADARLSANIPRMVGGLIQASNLPSYVDDVLEFASLASFPVTGETGKIYVALNTNLTYRWSGSAYVEISPSTAVWGSISGTLSSQTDLQTALNGKLNTSIGTTADLILGTGTAGAIETRTAVQVRTLLGLATTDDVTFNGLTITETTPNVTPFLLSGYSLTGTNAQSMVSLDGTWNTTGTPTAVDLNITDTASNAASLLLNLRTGGTSRFRVAKSGATTVTGGLSCNNLTVGTSGILQGGTNLIEQRNGTAGQIARWAKTWTSATNNEIFELDCAGNAATFDLAVCTGSVNATQRGLRIGSKFAGGAFSSWASFATTGSLTINGADQVLTLSSSTSFSLVRCFSAATPTQFLEFGWASGRYQVAAQGNFELEFQTNNTRRFFISGAGASEFLGDLTIRPSASRTPTVNGQFTIEMTSNTTGNLVYRGSDGTTRRMALAFT